VPRELGPYVTSVKGTGSLCTGVPVSESDGHLFLQTGALINGAGQVSCGLEVTFNAPAGVTIDQEIKYIVIGDTGTPNTTLGSLNVT
jgi:hypothetical protein